MVSDSWRSRTFSCSRRLRDIVPNPAALLDISNGLSSCSWSAACSCLATLQPLRASDSSFRFSSAKAAFTSPKREIISVASSARLSAVPASGDRVPAGSCHSSGGDWHSLCSSTPRLLMATTGAKWSLWMSSPFHDDERRSRWRWFAVRTLWEAGCAFAEPLLGEVVAASTKNSLQEEFTGNNRDLSLVSRGPSGSTDRHLPRGNDRGSMVSGNGGAEEGRWPPSKLASR